MEYLFVFDAVLNLRKLTCLFQLTEEIFQLKNLSRFPFLLSFALYQTLNFVNSILLLQTSLRLTLLFLPLAFALSQHPKRFVAIELFDERSLIDYPMPAIHNTHLLSLQ